MVEIRIPTQHLRKLPVPDSTTQNVVFFQARVLDLPVDVLEEWKDVNPRDVKETTVTFKSIVDTLKNAPARFYMRNRGITLSAKDLRFDEKLKEVVVVVNNKDLHGVIDGGHTLRACRRLGEAVEDELVDEKDASKAFVTVKVMLGISESEIAEVAGGLNTSQQVDLKSLENLQGHFAELKKRIAKEPYVEKIAFRMNEDKPLDVRDLLSYLVVFDANRFTANKHPVSIFGRKEGIIREFAAEMAKKDSEYNFKVLISKAPEILRFRDELVKEILKPEYGIGRFKASGKKDVRVRSARNKQTELYFLDEKVSGDVSLGWIMPMLGGFRANVVWDKPKGSFSWRVPLKKLLPLCIVTLVDRIKEIHQAEDARPEYVGRNAMSWRTCYEAVELAILRYEASNKE